MRPISVLLVDDNQVFLGTLTRFLEEECEGEILIVGAVSDGHDAIARALATQPEVVLLDLRMPGMPTMGILVQLREQLPQAVLVVVTLQDKAEDRQAALALGADGFVSKVNIADDLWPTIRQLVSTRRGPE